MKIAIIGYSGSGKSTLAKKLSKIYSCQVMYLDTINFKPEWKERDRNECKSLLKEFITNDSWVIDGNYRELYQERRLEEADKIIFMNFSRKTCIIQAYKRYLKSKNKVRESMAKGCTEKFDFEFIKWILIDGRNKKQKNNYKYICSKYKDKVIIFRTHEEVRLFLENL